MFSILFNDRQNDQCHWKLFKELYARRVPTLAIEIQTPDRILSGRASSTDFEAKLGATQDGNMHTSSCGCKQGYAQ